MTDGTRDDDGAETGRHATDWAVLTTVARFEGRKRLRVTGVIAVVLALFGALYLWVGPQMTDAGVSEMIDAMPPIVTELFNFESLSSIEGLLASEFYTLGWMVGVGGYVAYTAAGSVAGDFGEGRLDTLLAGPITRRSVLMGTYLALFVPIVALTVAVPTALAGVSFLLGASLAIGDLIVLHALSVAYLACWASIGLFVGVVVRRGRTAGRVALGAVLAAWLFESMIATTEYDWLGSLSPMRYLDPPGVLVDGQVDLVGAGILLVVGAVALALALVRFQREDL
ncbi:MAG: ABC transporter permease subunit [Halococcoides sp.]